MTIAELTTPKAGRICYPAAYWAVTDDDCVLFYKAYYSPQCNASESVVKHIRPDLKYKFIEMAFLPHNCHDYV
jgi:hypothetical protein